MAAGEELTASLVEDAAAIRVGVAADRRILSRLPRLLFHKILMRIDLLFMLLALVFALIEIIRLIVIRVLGVAGDHFRALGVGYLVDSRQFFARIYTALLLLRVLFF